MLITHISNNVLYKWWINTAKHYGSCHRISHMDHGPGTEILQFYDNIENAKKNIKHSNHFLMACTNLQRKHMHVLSVLCQIQ